MLLADENIPLMIASLAFVVICLLSIGIMIQIRSIRAKRRMMNKLRTDDLYWMTGDSENVGLALSDSEPGGILRRLIGAIGRKAKPSKSDDSQETKLKFLRAGLRGNNIATVFWGTKVLLAVLFPTTFFIAVVLFFKTMQANHLLLGIAFSGCLGLALPDLWLRKKTAERRDKLMRAFPDMLDLMVVCVEAGMGLDSALSRVGEELRLSHLELSQELKLLGLELRAGMMRNSALRNLANRTGINDVNSLVTLLIQTDRFGTSVAQALKVFADSFRTARIQRAEEFAAKISTKLIFPLALFIFPSFFVVAIGPAMVQIYKVLLKG